MEKYPYAFLKQMGRGASIDLCYKDSVFAEQVRYYLLRDIESDSSLMRKADFLDELVLKRLEGEILNELRQKEELQKEKERKEKEEIDRNNRRLLSHYPHGVDIFKKLHPSNNAAEVIQNEDTIIQYESEYLESLLYNLWKDKQNEHTNAVHEWQRNNIPNWQYKEQKYRKVFSNVNSKIEYFIPHMSALFTCSDDSLDYSDFQKAREVYTDRIPKLRDNLIQIKKQYYDTVFTYLTYLRQHSLGLCVVFIDSDATDSPSALNSYHFAYLRDLLEKNGICYYSLDSFPTSISRQETVVLIELISSTSIESVIKRVSEFCPKITRISIIDILSRAEMIQRIKIERDRKKKEREEQIKREREAEYEDALKHYPHGLDLMIKKYPSIPVSEFVTQFVYTAFEEALYNPFYEEMVALERDYETQTNKTNDNKQTQEESLPPHDKEGNKEQVREEETTRLYSLSHANKENWTDYRDHLRENGVLLLYHFTDRDNIQSIKEHGGLYSWKYCKEHGISIPRAGGGDMSRNLDAWHGLEDYVRLSFCKDHPMAFRLKQQGYNLVLLKINVRVAWLQTTLFSDINATDNEHHHGGSIIDLKRVDIRATQESYVSKESPIFKKHQAEVLVKTFIPLEYIENIENINDNYIESLL